MADTETATKPLVAKIVESPEFKAAVREIVEDFVSDAIDGIDLDEAVEKVLKNGTFYADASIDVSFTA